MKRLISFNYKTLEQPLVLFLLFLISQTFADFVRANPTKTNLTIFQLFMLFAFSNEDNEIVQ